MSHTSNVQQVNKIAAIATPFSIIKSNCHGKSLQLILYETVKDMLISLYAIFEGVVCNGTVLDDFHGFMLFGPILYKICMDG